MKKSDLVTRVATQASLSRPVADAAVNALLTAIADALANGETVTLARFGTFPTKTRPARQGRNSRTGEGITCERYHPHSPRLRYAFDDDKAGPTKTKFPHLGGGRHHRQPVPNFSVGRPLSDAVNEPASTLPDVHPHRKGHGRRHDRLSGRLAYHRDCDNDASGCAAVDPVPLTDSRSQDRIGSLTCSAPVTPMSRNRR